MLKRGLTFTSVLSLMSLLLTTSPAMSALGEEAQGTHLIEALAASSTAAVVPVGSVEAFDASGGFAIIDPETATEEWVLYDGIDPTTDALTGVLRVEPVDHAEGAWVQPATTSSAIPDVQSPEAGAVLGPLPQPVIEPVPVDPPDLAPVVIDPPDLAPVVVDPADLLGPLFADPPDLAPVVADPPDGEQVIDPPDTGPETNVDVAQYTDAVIGGAGLPAGVPVWGNVPIIDIPISEPYPVKSAFTPSAASTAAGPGEGAWSCYYYETNSANGGFIEGQPPDTNYGVDTALGAHTYNRAFNQPYDLTRNTSHSWASAGQSVTYTTNRGGARAGAVIVPWKVVGRFDLGTSCHASFGCGQADASTNVEIVLRDTTIGATLARRPVPEFAVTGDTVANYSDDGVEQIEFTWRPGHEYKTLIKITGFSTTDIPYPGLGARATNDAFTGQRRAYMEYVQWVLYGNYPRVTCS